MMKLIFQGNSFEDVKACIRDFAAHELDMAMKTKEFKKPRGRPKMTASEHLGAKKPLL